jgi:hypothetical protein
MASDNRVRKLEAAIPAVFYLAQKVGETLWGGTPDHASKCDHEQGVVGMVSELTHEVTELRHEVAELRHEVAELRSLITDHKPDETPKRARKPRKTRS